MNLVIFGAGGRTGRLLVQQALDAGHHVTAALRRPEALALQAPRLKRLRCDLFDATSVAQAVAGQDCALVAVAPTPATGPTSIFSSGIANILHGAPPATLQRIIVLGSSGIDKGTSCPWYLRLLGSLIVQPLLFGLYVDTARMESMLEMSTCNWTVLRPPLLTDKPGTGKYRVGVRQHLPNIVSIPRADVAHAMLRMIPDASTYRAWVEVAK